MRYYEIISESRSAPLYHTMDEVKTRYVFYHDEMPARWEHNISDYGLVKGNRSTKTIY